MIVLQYSTKKAEPAQVVLGGQRRCLRKTDFGGVHEALYSGRGTVDLIVCNPKVWQVARGKLQKYSLMLKVGNGRDSARLAAVESEYLQPRSKYSASHNHVCQQQETYGAGRQR